MLLLEDARGDGGCVVGMENRNGGLRDNFTLVKLLVDEMDGWSRVANARGDDGAVDVLSVHALATECG